MKTIRLWALVVLVVAAAVLSASVALRSGTARAVSVRLVDRKTDATGQFHIIYEVTNATSASVELTVDGLETQHSRTGWWDAHGRSTAWHVEKGAGVARDVRVARLLPFSAARLEILLPRFSWEGLALRGKLHEIQIETQAAKRLRSLAYRLHLPARWLPHPKPALVELSQVELPVPAGLSPVPSPAPIRVPGPALVAAPAPGRGSQSGTPNGAPAPAAPVEHPEETLPAGCIHFSGVELRRALDVYADLANADLEVEPAVRKLPATVTFEIARPMTVSHAAALLEEALRDQAGIRVKHLDAHRIAVACDGLLPKTNATH